MKTKKKLQLYRVTLPWDANDREEGDYCDTVWAKDEDAAVRSVATDMANASPEELSRKEYRAMIAEFIDGGGNYPVDPVYINVAIDIDRLLAGPSGQMSPEAQKAKDTIIFLLNHFMEHAQ